VPAGRQMAGPGRLTLRASRFAPHASRLTLRASRFAPHASRLAFTRQSVPAGPGGDGSSPRARAQGCSR
jgi:hypothetical protein